MKCLDSWSGTRLTQDGPQQLTVGGIHMQFVWGKPPETLNANQRAARMKTREVAFGRTRTRARGPGKLSLRSPHDLCFLQTMQSVTHTGAKLMFMPNVGFVPKKHTKNPKSMTWLIPMTPKTTPCTSKNTAASGARFTAATVSKIMATILHMHHLLRAT
jgi:hypothetical protein